MFHVGYPLIPNNPAAKSSHTFALGPNAVGKSTKTASHFVIILSGNNFN